MLHNTQRRDIQDTVVKSFREADYNGFGIAPTGVGKAWILIDILKKLKPKTCWYLCDSEDNRDITFKRELEKWGAKEYVDKIKFMCYQTAYKIKHEKVDLLLADEADFSLTKKYANVYKNNTFKHKVLISGTLANNKRKLLETLDIPIVCEIFLKEVENKKALNKARHYLVNFLLSKTENAKYLDYNRRFAKLLNSYHTNKEVETLQIMRKHFLSNLESSVLVTKKVIRQIYGDKRKKILIFCGLSEQADKICSYSYHSNTTKEFFDKYMNDEIRVLSVVSKADRGLNIPGVNVIILESPTRSSTKLLQRTGRGRRLDVNEVLDVYFLIPYFVDMRGNTRPTVVHDWVYKSAEKLSEFRPINFIFRND